MNFNINEIEKHLEARKDDLGQLLLGELQPHERSQAVGRHKEIRDLLRWIEKRVQVAAEEMGEG